MKNENFNGILDRHNSSLSLLVVEIDKDEFIEALPRLTNNFVLQTFFYLPNTGNTKILYLIRESHLHNVSSDKKKHERCFNLPLPLLYGNGNETFTSIVAQFFCYDDNEPYDIALSQSIFVYFIHPDLRNQVRIFFRHMDNFDFLPGSIYFMMVL